MLQIYFYIDCLINVTYILYVFCLQMVKEKPNSTRIYDKDGFRRRAACICVRSDAETEVLSFLFYMTTLY